MSLSDYVSKSTLTILPGSSTIVPYNFSHCVFVAICDGRYERETGHRFILNAKILAVCNFRSNPTMLIPFIPEAGTGNAPRDAYYAIYYTSWITL